MTDAMFYYTKTENCPIPLLASPLKGEELGSLPFKGEGWGGDGGEWRHAYGKSCVTRH